MRKKVIIIGAGENGEAVENIFSSDSNYAVTGFLDDSKKGEHILGQVKEFSAYLRSHYFFVSIGDNGTRKRIFLKLRKAHAKFAKALHPIAYIERGAQIGENVMVGAFAYINTACTIGDDTIVNTGSLIEHHTRIGDHSHLAPRVTTAGGVIIEDDVFIGIGTTIRDHTNIRKGGFVGAGSNVVEDTEVQAMYYGNPAKLVRYLR